MHASRTMARMNTLAHFEEQRPHLFAVAYRMLGSVTEAEDVLQDAWLRWDSSDATAIANPAGWLTTVVTRLCLDHFGSARVRRERYVGPWLPEPLVSVVDPADAAERSESLSMALLVVLESLSPLERAAFVLHEVFDYSYDDLAAMLERSPAACRQLVSRAHRHIDERPRRFPATGEAGRALVERFAIACATGDLDGLLAVLADDVTVVSDGGGVVHAARRAINGPAEVSRFLLRIAGKRPAGATAEAAIVNGGCGMVLRIDGRPWIVLAFDVSGDRIGTVSQVLNPAKLSHIV